jgi:hypothetical protein
MSNALAIAGVTAVLRDLLHEGLINHDLPSDVSNVKVTSEPPDIITTGPNEEDRLNLFFYQATPNAGWRNADLPARDAAGSRVANPPLALDLHYLLTAYGAKSFHAEILLGYAMQILHETPVLTRDDIRRALNPVPVVPPDPPVPVNGSILPGGFALLSAADLAEQAEQIRVTPQYLSTEEISKLWAATKANYRATCAYHVSVVLIETRRAARAALPVRRRNLLVLPLERPHIERVAPQSVASGAALTLAGRNLRAEITKANVGGVEVDPATLAATTLTVTVPVSLRPGVNTVQVVHKLAFGTGAPSDPHRGFESNAVAFMLIPTITVPATVARGADLVIAVAPLVERAQKVVVLLDDRAFLLPPRADGSPPAGALTLRIPADLPAKTYLVRVQIDGAESALELQSNAVEPDPLKKQYIGPAVVVT